MSGSERVPLDGSMARRREHRRNAIGATFPAGELDAALDGLALMDLAWHDCYSESCPPESVVEDVLTLADGDVGKLVRAALLAVRDFRDTRVAADEIRGRS